MKILKHLFPVPKEDAQRVITFANQNDFISFRYHRCSSWLVRFAFADFVVSSHHTFKKDGPKNVDLTEVGPRFEMRLYQIKLGTLGKCFPLFPLLCCLSLDPPTPF